MPLLTRWDPTTTRTSSASSYPILPCTLAGKDLLLLLIILLTLGSRSKTLSWTSPPPTLPHVPVIIPVVVRGGTWGGCLTCKELTPLPLVLLVVVLHAATVLPSLPNLQAASLRRGQEACLLRVAARAPGGTGVEVSAGVGVQAEPGVGVQVEPGVGVQAAVEADRGAERLPRIRGSCPVVTVVVVRAS